VDRQKKKGIKVYAVILLLTVAIGVISPYLPPTVDSSMSENYGKWTYDIPKFPQRQLSLLPQMEVTNLDEVLVMELQHTATVNTGIFRRAEQDTGRIRIEFKNAKKSDYE